MNNADKKKTVCTFRKMKERGEKIVVLTAYDYPTARQCHSAGADMLLVGDSLANTVLGYENTLPLTLDESLHHCKAARRGAPGAFIIGDMPFMSYQADINEALKNAARYLKEALMDAVKLEGGAAASHIAERFVATGIPVMGHIGLLPQKVLTAGGYKIAGKTAEDADRLLADARRLEEAGVFCIVLECVPTQVAAQITAAVGVPTIGIGAGADCDGQVQVLSDVLGLGGGGVPRHARRYTDLDTEIKRALTAYCDDVRKGAFPLLP